MPAKKINPVPPDAKLEPIPGTEYVICGDKVARVLDPANHAIVDGKILIFLKDYPAGGQKTFNLIIKGTYIRGTIDTLRKRFINPQA